MRQLALIVLLVFVTFPTFAADKEKESTYDRVMRTGTIRCGYYVAPPYFNKSPNDGSFSGIWYDYVEAMGDSLGLEIKWSLEVGLGDLITAIHTDKIDAYCGGLWNNPARARQVDFVTPISYQILFAYVREDDRRFDNNLEAANSADIKISCIDGEMADLIAQSDFPDAKTACLPQLSPYTDILINIAAGKADITFASPVLITKFNEANPDKKLRRVEDPYPLRMFPESIALKYGEHDFRRMLSHVTKFLLNSGEIDRILKKYEDNNGSFFRVAKPYEVLK